MTLSSEGRTRGEWLIATTREQMQPESHAVLKPCEVPASQHSVFGVQVPLLWLDQFLIGFRPPVSEELPSGAHVSNLIQV